MVKATNPDPAVIPTLGVWQDEELSPGRKLTMVSAAFPDISGFTCDAWCYEAGVEFIGARALDKGRLELRHRVGDSPNAIVVTTVIPEPGAVEFQARVELDPKVGGALPDNPSGLNLCWQVRQAPLFASAPDPYPGFVRRCFLFTPKGRTFLHKTTRRPIPHRGADDPYNNPPWVQEYMQAGQDLPNAATLAKSWAGYSPDRFTVPVIGVVSRDGNYLAALANDSAVDMGQAWHDCLHNNPLWLPENKPTAERVWRLKVYAMENDPDALLRRVMRDFPGAARTPGRAQPR